ncbi:MAG: ParA family protein [Acidobacteriota bacterium]
MPVIVVANPKGGVGKSTLSSNIAGYLARKGRTVMLGDIDRQQSSRNWLKQRPADMPAIHTWDVDENHVSRPPRGATHVVLDTPAGLHGRRLRNVLKNANKVLVPLQASMFDINPTMDFINEVADLHHEGRLELAVVGNRVRDNTQAADRLKEFLDSLCVPALTILRDTQNYVHLSAHGLTLWDVMPHQVEKDLEEWAPIVNWLK